MAREAGEEFVSVEVRDEGEGIPSKALPRIFERFFRADSSRARDLGGTGLGLAIVRHLIEGMGGRVEAESELGAGSTIRLVLPSRAPDDLGHDPEAAAERVENESSLQDPAEERVQSSTLFPGAANGAAA